MIPLRGKTALITGGSRGIGLAIAQHFARLGASTILVGRSAERLDRAVQSVREQPAGIQTQADSPPFHVSAEGDVACPETWASLVAKLSAGGFGQRLTAEDGSPDRVDVLVNCAGVSQNSLLVRAGIDEIQEILDVNLKSAVLGCKFIGKHMMRAGRTLRAGTSAIAGDGPSIINVSSVMATRGGAGAAVYAATKAGLLGKLVPGAMMFFFTPVMVLMARRSHVCPGHRAGPTWNTSECSCPRIY